jgi:type I restriction enzyme S subunit
MAEVNLPEGWAVTTLENVAVWGSGGTPSRKESAYYDGNVPWVKTGDLGPRVLYNSSEFISELAVQNSSAKYFPKGSVAIAMYGATIGKTSILGIDATTNQACGVGNPIEGITFSEFLYYFLINEKDNFIAKGKGGAQPNISQALIKEHEIALPPLAEQKVIAEKLDTLLALVDNTKARLERIPEILKRFRQSVLAAAVSGKLTEEWRKGCGSLNTKDLLDNYKPLPRPPRWNSRSDSFIPGLYAISVGKPEVSAVHEWEWVQLVDIAKMESGHTPSRSKPEYWGGDICWIGIKDANQNHTKTIYETEQKTNEHGLANSASRLLPENTVCISRTASVGYVVKMGRPMATSQDFVNWIPSSVVNPDWLKWLFVAERESLLKFGKGSTHTTVYFPEWLSMYVLLPHKIEQVEIVRRVDEFFAFADRIEHAAQAALSRVNNLTQSILDKAFRGELTADWRAANTELISGENSAEALLERIKAERAKIKTRKKA